MADQWNDKDDYLTEDIRQCIDAGNYAHQDKAMELVGNRHSKMALVWLVTYLLAEVDKVKAQYVIDKAEAKLQRKREKRLRDGK